jgi:hypothetical protein
VPEGRGGWNGERDDKIDKMKKQIMSYELWIMNEAPAGRSKLLTFSS